MSLLGYLFVKSAGIGIGVFVGVLVGFGLRKRRGNTEHLLANSVMLTALAAGCLAQVAFMLITYLGM
ncbi:MAG: hypothetical protein JXR13_05825 [Thalassovita sp.]